MSSQIKVELQEAMGTDKSIADSAWTSSNSLQEKQARTPEEIERIIKFLAKHKHSVPFESVIFRFWIRMPIQTDRQHVTHRIASHNGMSGRYRTMPSEFLDIPEDVYNITLKSLSELWKDDVPAHAKLKEYTELCEKTNAWYKSTLSQLKRAQDHEIITNAEYKRAREFFRGVLPQNNMTERVTTMNLRSFANYQKLRNSSHAQPEIAQVAQLMLQCVKDANIAPLAIAALEANNWSL